MTIEKIAVIGAGVMGSGIAAHITNAGIPVYLLDIVPKDAKGPKERNVIAEGAIAKMLKTQPTPFMHRKNARLITAGNTEDDLEKLAEVDWVIEAVIENQTIKQELYQKLDRICGPDTLISSNTSTLPLKILTADQSDGFKRRFMITHFFNPPRYMRLLELVSSTELDQQLFKTVSDFADIRLGKGNVLCKDTPGFIANRIGTFWMQTAVLEAIENELTVEQCDAALSLFGIPNTGIFGLLDLIGLDLMPHVLNNFKQVLDPEDRLHSITEVPAILETMIAEGYTGRKSKGGFYRLQPDGKAKVKQSIDLQQGDYRLSKRFKIEGVSRKPAGLRQFLEADNPLSQYVWRVWSTTFIYAAELIPEIADDIDAVDTAMRLGYNWRYGPFELLDRLGVEWFIHKAQAEQQHLPALIANGKSLYRSESGIPEYQDTAGSYHPIQRAEGVLLLSDIKLQKPAILENASASLWDIGDGIVCLEFHSKMNTQDPDSMSLIQQSIAKISAEYKGMVIYNEGEHFSAGANLTLLAPAILGGDWDTVKSIVQLGQNTFRALKYAPCPVVAAPSGLALGGGCEVLLHCDAIQAHAELYMGLVEVGVGLVPAWGGCKELLGRWLNLPKRPGGPMPPIVKTFETIGLAKVSRSAQEAKELLYMARTDAISMNKSRLLADAKARTLSMVKNYQAPEHPVYPLPGKSGWATLAVGIDSLHKSGKASAYDVEITQQLATVLTGGDTDITQSLTEQDLLDLELKSFIHLVQQPATLARLEHMLKTGKPLRN
ncbi:MAG TPA: 3-hydroxyacyl-CoA dehydrogenase/enoyl-CoA hydratase family protein [Methyloprofundus sp.]|uniref:3-hydroxyacyl-CoA dehydrogenase/enoyl-CoA hydratase family protein n=1 Tax=Methyloprofundus sp. TaxID=2020875 RepID=UPI0017D5B1BE|nr:3-hydroxyacyl-CoA dehydrogenase/enoyl-CoA hydratase family protein [Methyloprofundus sp.]HIG64243.1 3-hydroxyacyl-CoA dehydrogenase/enoyl-CoA hydratase family protein [Methyloprofundus sp.]HIL79005.1 3-hydroxyacyl-CoA dehydrogenase/enoyl-CoA hydratase family protein [Methylococcales bacterium]